MKTKKTKSKKKLESILSGKVEQHAKLIGWKTQKADRANNFIQKLVLKLQIIKVNPAIQTR